ncbi:MAG: topoisomerase DNA-binding C4 zinc finger domain-containing protein, partial [Syntrophaceae bacterium]|nr:topoisomerase DNA-binding C4 zinc finger domain-containing protein [Syntrophaceae bacterium]
GGFTARGKVFERDDMIVCSASGHLVELCMPEDLDKKKYGFWRLETLPIVPEAFLLRPSKTGYKNTVRKKKDEEDSGGEGGSELLNIIKREAKRKEIEGIVNACDAGREGELIFTYIVKYLNIKKPAERLWLQSMTPAAIREGFSNLFPTERKAGLADAAICRSESDWLVGINATRAFTVRLGGRKSKETLNLGRVQTPTLAILVTREREIQAFKPRDYWNAKGIFDVSGETYEGVWIREDFKKNPDDPDDRADRIWQKEIAESIQDRCTGKPAVATDKHKETREAPPPLFDLTTLQRESNKRFGLSAKSTLSAAQSLYEKYKVLTYPRTDSKCLPEDYRTEVKRIMSSLGGNYASLAQKIGDPSRACMAHRIFDNKKISDHFAIIPTGEAASGLSEIERKVYDLVVRRFLAAFMDAAVWKVVERTTRVGDDAFRTTARLLAVAGWREAFGREDDLEPEIGIASRLPGLDDTGAKIHTIRIELQGCRTNPPPRYNDATLLAAMETAGKLLDDEELAEAMKERGLGTPATRAETIERLIAARYVTRERKDLIPTSKAMNIIQLLEAIPVEGLVSPTLTGEWEHKLLQMEKGQISRSGFMHDIIKFTENIVEKARSIPHDPTDLLCEKCNSPMIIKWGKNGRFLCCSNYPECKNIKNFTHDENGKVKHLEDQTTDIKCNKCGKPMLVKEGRYGQFLACSGYPECKTTMNATRNENGDIVVQETPVTDEVCNLCGKPMAIKRGRYGQFLGCTGYPDCKNIQKMGKDGKAAKAEPVLSSEVCDLCGKPMAVKRGRYGQFLGCTGYPDCKNIKKMPKIKTDE